jgi:hypothetical protein
MKGANMRKTSFVTHKKYVGFVKELVGNKWLSQELKKIKLCAAPEKKRKLSFIGSTDKIHPLANLIYQADQTLEAYNQKGLYQTSEQIFKLSCLGENLFILKEKGIRGLDEKVKELISSKKELYDKTNFEIQVAAAYTKEGHPVEFLETISDKKIKTHDVFIDFQKGIEVECKKKGKQGDRDKKNIEHWKEIKREASIMMDQFNLNYAVLIKTEEDLVKEDIEFVLKKLQKLMKERKEGEFVFKDRGIGIVLKILSEKDQMKEMDGIYSCFNKKLDYKVLVIGSLTHKEETMFCKNPRFFGFKNAVIPDRIKSVIESIKDAKKKLSGNLPGLIYVNLNMTDPSMLKNDFERLDTLIKKSLENNSTITAVIITSDFFLSDSKRSSYSHKTMVIKNENTKYVLPSDFEIIGESLN